MGVMVEFDDGDRGKISLPNIRLLPPGYQIQCKLSGSAIWNIHPSIINHCRAANKNSKKCSIICELGGGSSPAPLTTSGTIDKRGSGLEQAPVSDRPSDRLSAGSNSQTLTVPKRRPGKTHHLWNEN